MVIFKKWTALAVVMIAFLSSCEVKEIHEDYYEVYLSSFTANYSVFKRDWKVGNDDSGDYLYYEFRETNLTQYIYENGAMQAFLVMENGNLTPLPFNDYWIDVDYMWTEQVTCEFRPGYVTFILKYSDHASEILPYYDYTFRVRFLW